jgi:hypothetical protein
VDAADELGLSQSLGDRLEVGTVRATPAQLVE